MKAIQLYTEKQKPAGVWVCQKCRTVKSNQHLAEECCSPRLCAVCEVATTSTYYLSCDSCRAEKAIQDEKKRFDNAEKLTQWDGPIYCSEVSGYNEGFYTDLGDLFDHIEDCTEPIEYVYCCDSISFINPTLERLDDWFYDEGYDGFEPDDLKGRYELEEAFKIFTELNNGFRRYEIDYKKILLTPDLAEEISDNLKELLHD